jgi:hypothetical protein
MSKRDHEEFETAFARFKENPSAGAIDAFTFEQWGRQYDADILRGWLYFQTHYPGATPVIDCKGLPCSWCRCLYCISQYRCIPE